PLSAYHRGLPSFPTRRSSDLPIQQTPPGGKFGLIGKTGACDAGQRVVVEHVVLAPVEDLHGHAGGQPDLNNKLAQQILLALGGRSEEHTSELQSRENLVCRLL